MAKLESLYTIALMSLSGLPDQQQGLPALNSDVTVLNTDPDVAFLHDLVPKEPAVRKRVFAGLLRMVSAPGDGS